MSNAHDGTFFVGRSRELDFLRYVTDEVVQGSGRLVLVAGEAGIGKTRIALELARRATDRGFRVFWGRCTETGGAPPYWPWVQIVRDYLAACGREECDAAMSAGGSYIGELIDIARRPFEPVLPEPEEARFRLFDSAASVIKVAAGRGPVLLALDDIHAADRPSLLLLEFLAREIANERVLIVATYRDTEAESRPPLLSALTELAREPLKRAMTIGGLSEDDVGLYVELNAGQRLPSALLSALYRRTDGNPFFLGEIVLLLMSNGHRHTWTTERDLESAIPASVRGAILRRLERLPEDARHVLTHAAVVGRQFSIAVLHGLLELSADAIVETLQRAASMHLIFEMSGASGRYAFTHALVREALYGELPVRERIRLHQEIGAVLESVHRGHVEPRLPELAHHFLAGAPGGSIDKAIDYAVKAGSRALRLMAYEEATRHYELALQALELRSEPDGRRRFDILLMLNAALWSAGDVARARAAALEAVEIARANDWPDDQARAALAFAGRLGGYGVLHFDAGVISLLEEALAALGPHAVELRARLMARLAEELTLAPSHEQRWTLGREAIVLARRSGDSKVLGAVLKSTYWALWTPEGVEDRLSTASEIVDLAERDGDRVLSLEGHILRLQALIEIGDTPAIRRELWLAERGAADIKNRYLLWVLASLRVCLAFLEGRLDEVNHLVTEAMRLDEPSPASTIGPLNARQIGHLFLLQGQLEVLEPRILELIDLNAAFAEAERAALAFLYADRGRVEDARHHFEILAADDFAGIPRHTTWGGTMAFLAETCARLGDATRAARLYAMLLPLRSYNLSFVPLHPMGPAEHHLAILATTLHRWDAARAHFEAAIEMEERLGTKQWLARTQTSYAAMLMALGNEHDAQAAVLLEQAIDVAQLLDLTTVTTRASALRSELLGRMQPGAAPPARSPDDTLSPNLNVFRCDGEIYTIIYAGRTVRMKDAKGLRYYGYLLRRPGVDVPAMELVADAAGGGPCHLERPPSDAGPILDGKARTQLRERRRALRGDLAEAEEHNDLGRAAAIREEIDRLEQQLRRAFGLGGRARNFGDLGDADRLKVTKGIGAVLEKLRRMHPALAHHLDTHVRTGRSCCYAVDPEHPVRWTFEDEER
jgi:tetratricopeptide (TPR) repeat protein